MTSLLSILFQTLLAVNSPQANSTLVHSLSCRAVAQKTSSDTPPPFLELAETVVHTATRKARKKLMLIQLP